MPSGEVVHLENFNAPQKSHKKVDQSTDADQSSSANGMVQEGDASPATTQSQEMGQKHTGTTPKTPRGDDMQTLPHPDTSNSEDPSFRPGVTPSKTEVSQAIPESMQGFDEHEATPDSPDLKEEKILPHKRIPPPAPSIPVGMQDSVNEQPEQKEEKASRIKEKVHIRQTSQGWVEFDKEKEDELRKRNGAEHAADDTKPVDTEEAQTPIASTQASWQAFAGSTPSSSFEVSSQVTRPGISLTFTQLQPEDKTTLLSYFSPFIVEEVLALHNRIVDSPHRKTKDYGMVTSGIIDRQKRTAIHQDIRRIFNSRLETMTGSDGAMRISAMAEKPTFYARNPISTDTCNNVPDSHRDGIRGNDRGQARVKGEGSGQINGRGNNDRSRTQAAGGARGKTNWEDRGGRYLHFSLYKENKDTMEAVSWLARQLKMSVRSFQYAGTKDRRAVTVQRVSVERIQKSALGSAGRTLRHAHLGSFEYRPHPLQLGDLGGNEFVVTLRDCDFHYPVPMESEIVLEGARAVVSDAVKNLRERGFINYYGLQRFGTYSIGTEAVGLKMLQGDYQGAVDAILDYSPASLAAVQNPSSGSTDKVSMDDRARTYVLHSFRTTDRPDPALWELPRKYSAELSIIRHLTSKVNRRTDWLGALQTIPRNLRLIYVHAYQSLVWNSVVSVRWKRFGPSVIEGDLVLVNDHKDKTDGIAIKEDVDSDGEVIVRPGADDRAADLDDMFERARALTKTEAESGAYNIFDIVLPTPGFDIVYPPNEIGKFYEEFMASERGGGINPYDMRRDWRDISLSGSYRKILARPGKDISFEIKTYKDDDEQFVQTDLDRLRQSRGHSRRKREDRADPNYAVAGPPAAENQQDAASTQKNDYIKNEINNNDNPKVQDLAQTHSPSSSSPRSPESEDSDPHPGGVSLDTDYKIAVILKLQLGASQYATMALRELLKAGGLKMWKADFSGR